jgi:release factor glutamine methyltransferase
VSARALFAAAAAALESAGVDSARLDARLLLAYALGAEATTPVSAMPDPDEAQRKRFETLVARRVAREPLAYITGHKEFWSLDFAVGPGVLVPRPETETLVETLGKLMPDRGARLEILDLGTGSGCLLIAALSEYRNARGTGVERSPAALCWARQNLAALGLETRAQLEEVDWTAMHERRFDVILSNPPYIKSTDVSALAPEVARYEPLAALDGGADGLEAYRALAPRIRAMLKPAGLALIEIGEGQAGSIPSLFDASGVNTEQIVPDLAGIPRCFVGRASGRAA